GPRQKPGTREGHASQAGPAPVKEGPKKEQGRPSGGPVISGAFAESAPHCSETGDHGHAENFIQVLETQDLQAVVIPTVPDRTSIDVQQTVAGDVQAGTVLEAQHEREAEAVELLGVLLQILGPVQHLVVRVPQLLG